MNITIEKEYNYYRKKWLFVAVYLDEHGNIDGVSPGYETEREARMIGVDQIQIEKERQWRLV
jgi:hypothetical protein